MATPNHLPPTGSDYTRYETYQQTTEYLRSKLPQELHHVEIGIVCGSGLGGLALLLEAPIVECYYKDIPHFATSTVQGHVGKLVFGMLGGKVTVCMVGRKHMYEGHSLLRTVYPIRIMKLLGCHSLIVTNAAGGLNPDYAVGDIMVISDHISMAGLGGQNALIGPNMEEFGPRFPPVSDAYDTDLRILVYKAAHATGMSLNGIQDGVYCFVAGPSFETRAEARFLRMVGGDAVGMSTVPEVVVARHCGLRVVGLSLITNKVAQGFGSNTKKRAMELLGLIPQTHEQLAQSCSHENIASHEEVLETSKLRSEAMQNLVRMLCQLI